MGYYWVNAYKDICTIYFFIVRIMYPLIDENGLAPNHRRILRLLDYMGGTADLEDFVLKVYRKGWYRSDFYAGPIWLKNIPLNPMSISLRNDLLYLEQKGYIRIEQDRVIIQRNPYRSKH